MAFQWKVERSKHDTMVNYFTVHLSEISYKLSHIAVLEMLRERVRWRLFFVILFAYSLLPHVETIKQRKNGWD